MSATLPAAAPAELSPKPPEPLPTPLRMLLLLGLFAVPLLAVLQPGVDWDLWWHLRVGQWVVDHGTVPTTDPFSFHGRSQGWVAYSWLFEVIVYGLDRVFGLYGPLVYAAVLSLAVMAAVYRLIARRQRHFLYGVALAAAVALTLGMLFKQRPWLFTILFSTLTLDALLDLRAGRKTRLLWALPFCYVVWANVHIQFVYGLALLGLAVAAPILDALLSRNPDADRLAWRHDPRWRTTVVLAVVCFLATLVNPYHVRLYGVVLEYAGQPGPYRWVSELRAPEFRGEVCEWLMLGLFAASAFALGRRSAGAGLPRPFSSFDVLLLAGAGLFAFRARRDVWCVAVAAAAMLSTTGPAVVPPAQRFRLTRPRLAVLAVGVALLALLIGVARRLTPERLREGVAEHFPTGAAAFVREQGYKGRLFNDFTWGGYLIHETPDLAVVVDGRTNLHGDERTQRVASVWIGAPGWRDDPDLSAADVVIANREDALAELLLDDRRFKRVFEDSQARVFVRRRGQSGEP